MNSCGSYRVLFPISRYVVRMYSVNGATGWSGLESPLGSDTGLGWECPRLSFSCCLFEHPDFVGCSRWDFAFEAQ